MAKAGTVNHKILLFKESHRNNPFRLYFIQKNNWLEKDNGTIFESK